MIMNFVSLNTLKIMLCRQAICHRRYLRNQSRKYSIKGFCLGNAVFYFPIIYN